MTIAITTVAWLLVSGCSPAPTVLSVSIEGGDINLYQGDSRVLQAVVVTTGRASTAVEWSSDDETVASVDQDGAVSAHSVGSTTITAISVFDSSKAAEVRVTVVASPSATIEIVQGDQVLIVDQTVALTAVVTGASDDAINWSATCGTVIGTGLEVSYQAPDTPATCVIEVTLAAAEDVGDSVTVFVVAGLGTEPMRLRIDTRLEPGTTIGLPLFGVTRATVDWGDGTTMDVDHNGLLEHTYLTEAVYEIAIDGTLLMFGTGDVPYPGAAKVTDVIAWGDLGLVSLAGAFAGASNLITVPATLPSTITDLSYTFYLAERFDYDIGAWDTRNVRRLMATFADALAFNQDIGDWDTGNVTSMRNTFFRARSFNRDIRRWDTSNVTEFDFMFYEADAFDQDIGDWDTSSALYLTAMFNDARAFNQDLSRWDTRQARYMHFMFAGAGSFDQPIGRWDTSSVETMNHMFAGATSFDQDLSGWDTAWVTTMESMFQDAHRFDQDLDGWDTSSVESFYWMFADATSFNGDISSWDVSNATALGGMFRRAATFDRDIGRWDVSRVTDMAGLFAGASRFDRDLSGWDTSSVTSMGDMFAGATNFSHDITGWDTSRVTNMALMFAGHTAFDQPIGSWDTSSVSNFWGMFSGATAFNQDIGRWDTGRVTTMENMFMDATAFNQDIGAWNTGNVENMRAMFWNATSFDQNLDGWCVLLIDDESKRVGFDTGASAWSPTTPRPAWGTCPDPSQVPVIVSLTPTAPVVIVNETVTFTANVSGTADTAVSWSTGDCGTIDGSGLVVSYTAPSTAGNCTVTATCLADPSKSASAWVTVLAQPLDEGRWTRQFGTAGTDIATAVTHDDDGNILIVGWTTGSLAGTSGGAEEAFARMYDALGTVSWTRQFGAVVGQVEARAAVVSEDAFLVAGWTEHGLDGATPGGFIRALDDQGETLWTWPISMGAVNGIAIDPGGHVLIVGDEYVAKLDGEGSTLWSLPFTDGLVFGVAGDADGNVLVVGSVLGDDPGERVNPRDAFVQKLDGDGIEVWRRQFAESNYLYGVAVSSDGEVAVGGDGGLVRLYGADGTERWTRYVRSGWLGHHEVVSLAFDPSQRLVVAGSTTGALEGVNFGEHDAFLRGFDIDGDILWTRQFGTIAHDFAGDVAIDAGGRAVIAGITRGDLATTNQGAEDVFLRAYGP